MRIDADDAPPVMMPIRRRPARRTGLFLLAFFMGLSGVLRLGTGFERALAAGGDVPAVAVESPDNPDAGTAALLQALREREARVAEQEKRLADRDAALRQARAEIDKKIAELKQSEGQLAATLSRADQAAEKDVGKLVSVYENMKPKDAARLFSEMDPEFAAGFVGRMQPAAAAALMAGLDPAKAYAISAVLAGQNARAPKS